MKDIITYHVGKNPVDAGGIHQWSSLPFDRKALDIVTKKLVFYRFLNLKAFLFIYNII